MADKRVPLKTIERKFKNRIEAILYTEENAVIYDETIFILWDYDNELYHVTHNQSLVEHADVIVAVFYPKRDFFLDN